ncbi:NADH dehydrogenase [ubiquinone] 1 alpha subcomplex assembly factor 2 isoform 3-T5 [Hipposideros larvatus]
MGRSQNLFRALWRALSKEVKEQVGTDQFGNKYYYIPEYKNWRGQTIREKRIVEAANKREVDYEVGTIPAEWEAWIKRTRKTPPTMEDYLIVAYYNKHKGKVKLSFILRAGRVARWLRTRLGCQRAPVRIPHMRASDAALHS